MKPQDEITTTQLLKIHTVKILYSANDANRMLSMGGMLLGVSTFGKAEDDPKESGVRFVIGFEPAESEIADFVRDYRSC